MAPSRRAGDREREALARNDRYLREFVEALNLCPFARRCREEGRLVRRVLLDEYVQPALLRAVAEIDTLPEKQCEVALLLVRLRRWLRRGERGIGSVRRSRGTTVTSANSSRP